MRINKEINNGLWISWERHRRSESLAMKFGVPLKVVESSNFFFFRYIKNIFSTLIILLDIKPRILFIQNPSSILTILTILCRSLFRYKLIVDAHNAGVYVFEEKQKIIGFLFPFMHRKADYTIVTNNELKKIVEKNGGKALVLPDPIPNIKMNTSPVKRSDNKFLITFICSYGADEPYDQVFKAAQTLPEKYFINVTGDYNKLPKGTISQVSSNINFTGFLSDEEYQQQLVDSDCILVLTTLDDCLVCGAYEAVAAGVPLVVSDTPALRWWFGGKGVVFCKNTPEELVKAFCCVFKEHNSLKYGMEGLRSAIQNRWQRQWDMVLGIIGV